jgi:hypothetical protein
MPSAVQVRTLVNSHYTGDDEQFNTVALQIAASEARQGHEQFAKDLERLVDAAQKKNLQNGLFPYMNHRVNFVLSFLFRIRRHVFPI